MIAIELTGGSVLYASNDGRYLIAGDLYEIGDTLVNVAETGARRKAQGTDRRRFAQRHGDLSGARQAQGRHHRVHRRRLHLLPQAAQEVPQMNKMGVEVRYLAYPRGGRRFARLRQTRHRVVFERIGRTRSRA